MFFICTLNGISYFLSRLIWIADCMQFLPENCLNSCQIFGRFGSFKTEAEPICSFLHTPTTWMLFVGVPLFSAHPYYLDVICRRASVIRISSWFSHSLSALVHVAIMKLSSEWCHCCSVPAGVVCNIKVWPMMSDISERLNEETVSVNHGVPVLSFAILSL